VPVSELDFAPAGRTLAALSSFGRVILWDLADRAQPVQIGQPIAVPGGLLFGVAFDPAVRTLATTATDGSVILWDLSDPERPIQLGEPLTIPGALVYWAAFNPDRRTLAAVGDNGTVIVWDLTGLNNARDQFLERACDLTVGGPSRDEWTRHVPGLPYEETCSDR
jgi:WD40 repeat protein